MFGCLSLTVFAAPNPNIEDNALESLADYLHLSHSKDPTDGGWLPNLTGLPDANQVALLTQHAEEVMSQEKDARCTSINWHLRMLFFQHFVIYQHMANAQNIYFDEKVAEKWAHLLAMTVKESSGDSTNVTDMRGHSSTTNKSKTDIQHWNKLLSISEQGRIKLNKQTNFGLTQTSTDRLFVAFNLAQNAKISTAFLEGKNNASTTEKVTLNTAIAIRRLIWLYQDFAQGRLTQSDTRIHQKDIDKPEFSARYKAGLDMALLYCGTGYMFSEGHNNIREKDIPKLENAMASIAYCKLGNAQSGYGLNTYDEQCFAEWVTLCPALNLDIAALTPLSYFATRGEAPVCTDTFTQLLTKKPENK